MGVAANTGALPIGQPEARELMPPDGTRFQTFALERVVADAGVLAPFLLGGFVRDGQSWLAMSLDKVAASDVFSHAGW